MELNSQGGLGGARPPTCRARTFPELLLGLTQQSGLRVKMHWSEMAEVPGSKDNVSLGFLVL